MVFFFEKTGFNLNNTKLVIALFVMRALIVLLFMFALS